MEKRLLLVPFWGSPHTVFEPCFTYDIAYFTLSLPRIRRFSSKIPDEAV
jgi:hypothetical protein